jgi:GT2 family glycosyltransferase
MAPMADIRLSIVIPTWNQIAHTRACVATLRANTDVSYELIIVDNGSEHEEARAAETLADVFIGNDENLGFARAMNQGLRVAGGEFVAFVNNDTEFPAAWASKLIATFESSPAPGIVLPAVSAAGNSASVRTGPAERLTVFEPFTAIPSGVVYLMNRAIAADLGGWNEQYGVASSEDLDLLFTVWSNGLSVILDERVFLTHASAVTAAKLPGRHSIYTANRLQFAKRWAEAGTDDVPRIAACPPAEFASNLEKARIAGTWMLRWFETKDELAAAISLPDRPVTQATRVQSEQAGKIHRLLRRLRG